MHPRTEFHSRMQLGRRRLVGLVHSCSSSSGWKTSLTRLMAANHRFINQRIRACKCSPPSDLCTPPVPQRQERVGEEASKGQAGQHVCTPRAHFYPPPCTGLVCGPQNCAYVQCTHVGTPLLLGRKQPWQGGREGCGRPACSALTCTWPNLHNHCQSPTPVSSLILQEC